MRKLKSKTFYTIFGIISLFLVIVLVFYNVQNYKKEYDSIKNNLIRMNDVFNEKRLKKVKPKDKIDSKNSLNNRIVMDYEVYTVMFDDSYNIIEIINHSDKELSSDITNVANEILQTSSKNGLNIGNLYFSDFSYLINDTVLTIVDNSSVKKNLLFNLLVSTFLLVVLEIITFLISRRVTNWIIKPAIDSFNKQKDFIADASHELKTPLAVIMACVDSLETDRNKKKWISNIKNEIERMNKLIASLLELSKLSSGVSKELYTMNNLSKIIEKASLTFESLAYENNVSLKMEIDDNISFNCSAVEINELLGILLDNAIKHSYKDSDILISLKKNKNDIVLEVTNNGDAIKEEEYDKIFERFYRVDKSRNRNANRYGLGLAIAKNIVINHGGSITVFSKDGFTTFKVLFKNKGH
ncbi:MAG: sensor histidine kinase [Bacilli bacterium]